MLHARTISRLRLLAVLFLVSLLAGSCGGGGGSSGFSVSVATHEVSFSELYGFQGASQNILAYSHGSTDAGIYLAAAITGIAISPNIMITISADGSTATFNVYPLSNLAVGTYTGTLTLMACYDPDCAHQVSGSPQTINYTVTVLPVLQVSATSVDLAAAESAIGAASSLNLSVPPANGTATATVSYDPGASDWLQVQNNQTSLVLTPNAGGLLKGTYTALLSIANNDPLQRLTVKVRLTVSDGLVVPAGAYMAVDSETPAGGTQGALTISTATGVTLPTGWNATSDQSWLVLDTAHGSGGDAMTWHLDPATFGLLPYSSAPRQAVLTVNGGTGVTPATVTVTVADNIARIYHPDALALKSGEGGEVLVYGHGFDSLADPASRITVGGGIVPLSVTRLGSGLLSLVMPTLTTGNYDIGLGTASGIVTPTKPLRVLAPQNYAYQAIATTSGRKGALVWSAVNQSMYVVDQAASTIMRYGWDGTAFGLQATRALVNVDAIAVDRDQDALIAYVAAPLVGSIYRLDLQDLHDLGSGTIGTNYAPLSLTGLQLPVTGDNSAWIGAATVDLDSLQTTAFGNPAPGQPFDGVGWGTVSANGRHMLAEQESGISPSGPILQVDMADAVVRALSVAGFYQLSTDRKGDLWTGAQVGGYVDDFSWSGTGELLTPIGWNIMATALSDDGTRAYVLALADGAISMNYSFPQESTTPDLPRVFVFDTSVAQTVPTTSYPLLGYYDIQDYAACRSFYTGCLPVWTISVSADNRTLFMIGDRKFIVSPIPSQYQPSPISVRKREPAPAAGALHAVRWLPAPP